MTEANPLLEIARQIIFHENKEITVERPEKFGGNVTYTGFEQMHADFANSKLHPGDLKETVSSDSYCTGLAQKFSISDEARRTILDRSKIRSACRGGFTWSLGAKLVRLDSGLSIDDGFCILQ